MPYVTTAKSPCSCVHGAECVHAPVVARYHVATLNQARQAAHDAVKATTIAGFPFNAALLAVDEIPDSGGRVGPLPDGTLITVEREDDQ